MCQSIFLFETKVLIYHITPILKFDFRYYLWSSVLSSSRFWMALILSSIFLFAQDVNFCVSFISQDRQRWKLSLIMCLKYLLNSHPGWSHYHQFLLHHWSEKYNFSTNRLFCLKRRFLYIIWPPIFKFDFRYYLWSSVASSSGSGWFWILAPFLYLLKT